MRPSPASRPAALAALLASVLAGLAGCTTRPDLAPHPLRLVPAGGPAGAEATVIIEGTGFLARASQAASGGAAALETTHTASLDGVALTGVTWLDAGRLRATIPAGLGLGPHRLTVVNALGATGALDAAWTVIEPAALELEAAAPGQVIQGRPFTLSVTARNPGGAAVRGVLVTVAPAGAGPVGGDLAPAAFDLEPGATRVLELTLTASAAGTVSLGVSAGGREDFTGRIVAAEAPAASLVVRAPAALVLEAAVSIGRAIEGQPVTLTVTATNAGGTALRGVGVAVTASGSGAVAGDLTSPAFDLEPGATQQLRLALTAAAAGPVTFEATASGREDLSDRLVSAGAPPAALSVQAPAALVLTASAPPQAIAGLPFTLSVTATNTGGSALRAVAVTVTPSGPGAVGGDLAPPAFDLPPGATQPLQLALTASAAGAVSLGVAAGGLEELGDRPVSAVAAAPALLVQAPAALALSAALAPAQASVGQPVTLTVSATNTGGTALRGVAVVVAPSGEGAVTGDLGTPAFDLPPGATEARQLALTAAAAGAVTLGVTASGAEALSDRVVAAGAPGALLLVQARAALVAAIAIPSTIPPDTAFQATLTVLNEGEAAAEAVVPGALALAPDATGAATLISGPAPDSATVPGGGQATFTWSWRLTGAGTVRLRGGAAGVDANDGLPVAAATSDSNLGSQLPEVAPAATDPLGDGTPVAAMAARGGLLYVGPSTDGSRFWRLDPAAGTSTTVGVEIGVDTGPSPADNTRWRATPPATTFGAAGCKVNSTACGPNDEVGLGTMAAGRFAGSDWLLYTPASYVKARYVYLAAGDTAPLAFQSVDLGEVLPISAAMPTALGFAPGNAAVDDRLYVAWSDGTARKSPYLVALRTAPTGPWLDAAAPDDAVELGAAAMPELGGAFTGAGIPRLEAVAAFRGLLYLGSAGGVMRSTVPVPRPYPSAPADWAEATPPAWSRRTSVTGAVQASLRPADLAVPAVAPFGACGGGPCLFLARNVVGASPAVAPQLWGCDPGRTGDPAACDPGDWALVAPNERGDATLTQLGDPGNGALSVLLATPRYLYVGFDNAAGAQLFRAEAVPGSVHDFRGRDGCAAGIAGCQGLGGNGLGLAELSRFFDARAVTAGGVTTVYVAAGDASGALRLFAIPE